jgi:hypothetical protein
MLKLAAEKSIHKIREIAGRDILSLQIFFVPYLRPDKILTAEAGASPGKLFFNSPVSRSVKLSVVPVAMTGVPWLNHMPGSWKAAPGELGCDAKMTGKI